nr:HAMP domain-containing sensor histidine kinase [Kitasatospora sp. MAA4]
MIMGPEEQPPPGGGGWYARMSLRRRLALLTAVAVSLAVLLCATASWFFARDQMMSQVNQTLKQSVGPISDDTMRHLAALCTDATPYDTGLAVPTVVFANGRACPPDDRRAVLVTPADVRIAASRTAGPGAQSGFRAGRTKGGTPVEVYVVSVPVPLGHGAELPMALLVSQPFDPVQDALDRLALLLAGLSVLVIAGSTAGAFWVAHGALRPVARLTEAVEEIARTQKPGTTVAVVGTDAIARLGRSFNAMSTALASSRERQSQLIADAGHELRTPLTALRTNVDLLVRSEESGRPLPEQTRSKLLRTLKAQMAELSTLIGDLLELSRPARAEGAGAPQVTALHDIVSRALDRARLRGPGLDFTVELSPWYARVDVHAMERAVINLLDNAVKFSPPGGAVEVRLRAGTLTVRDHGPGIPAEDLPHVFERFWRSPAARQLPGSGLGLAIVAQTVHDAGGRVSLAAAEPGPGSTAVLSLPGGPTSVLQGQQQPGAGG